MNIERLTKIAEWLEAGGDEQLQFDMTHILARPRTNPEAFRTKYQAIEPGDCATVACIAGKTIAEWGDVEHYARTRMHQRDWWGARELLGLTPTEADELFAPADCEDSLYWGRSNWPWNHKEIDAAWAARTVRYLIETGEVRWDLTKE